MVNITSSNCQKDLERQLPSHGRKFIGAENARATVAPKIAGLLHCEVGELKEDFLLRRKDRQ